jgi:hypothetical protein
VVLLWCTPRSDVAPPHVLQVLGNAKGVIAAVVSVMVFANPVTWRGVVGYAVTIFGVLLYSEVSSNVCAGNICCQQVVRLLSTCHSLSLLMCAPSKHAHPLAPPPTAVQEEVQVQARGGPGGCGGSCGQGGH